MVKNKDTIAQISAIRASSGEGFLFIFLSSSIFKCGTFGCLDYLQPENRGILTHIRELYLHFSQSVTETEYPEGPHVSGLDCSFDRKRP
jgi:hypothetical protein